MERIASFTENKKGNACKRKYSSKAVKVVSEACPHSSKANAREKKNDLSSCKSYIWTNKKKQQLNERHSLFPRNNLVVYSNCSGNL